MPILQQTLHGLSASVINHSNLKPKFRPPKLIRFNFSFKIVIPEYQLISSCSLLGWRFSEQTHMAGICTYKSSYVVIIFNLAGGTFIRKSLNCLRSPVEVQMKARYCCANETNHGISIHQDPHKTNCFGRQVAPCSQ